MKYFFYRTSAQPNKKVKLEDTLQLDESNDKTLYTLLNLPKANEKPLHEVDTEKLSTFSNLLQKFTADHTLEKVNNILILF